MPPRTPHTTKGPNLPTIGEPTMLGHPPTTRVALTIAHLDGRNEVIPADIDEAATFTA